MRPVGEPGGLAARDLVVAVGRRGEERVVLAGTDLRVAPGEALLITGPRGSGKSALAGALEGGRALRHGTVRPADGGVVGWSVTGGSHAPPTRAGRRKRRDAPDLESAAVLVVDDADWLEPAKLAHLVSRRRSRTLPTVALAQRRLVGFDRYLRLDGLTLTPEPEPEPAPERSAAGAGDLVVSPEQLEQLIVTELEAAGTPTSTAATVASVLTDADRRGHHSHGVELLPTYLARIRAGGIDASASLGLVGDGATLKIDARGGFGQVAATRAALECAQRADEHGVAAVGVSGNNHVGMMAAYRWPFQRHRVVGFLTNVSGPSVAPPGGTRPTIGSDAICLVVPGEQEPFCVDFGTGVVSAGKVRAAGNRGLPVPAGWLLDAAGNPCAEPAELERGGSIPVFGGHKGLCTAVIAEVLAGVLGGATVSPLVAKQRAHPEQVMGCAQMFIGISLRSFPCDPAALIGVLRRAVRDSYETEPEDPWFPDQYEERNEATAGNEGIAVPSAVATALGWTGR